MIYLPILGAVALASGLMLERFVLKKKKIDIKLYMSASFLAIVLAMLLVIWFFWRLDSQALSPVNIFIFSLVVLFSIIANLFTFYSMKWEKVSNLEPAKVLEPLFVVLLAIVFSFFTTGLYERNLDVIVPAIIAALALVFSHVKRKHIDFNKYFIAAIFGSFFFALELIISRLILNFYSPMTFYLFRSTAIFLISLIIFTPKFKKIDKKTGWLIFFTGAIWVLYRTIVYYGFVNLGVVFTTLLIMLGPVFVFIFARIFLKEKLNWKNVVAVFVVVACVLYAILV